MHLRRLSRAALLAAVLAAGTASADERLEARRHFRVGMALISEKQYDEGIRELEAAFAIKPHPNVLFNIARAWVDAGRDEKALEAYRRYLAFAPSDASRVESAVRELEARVQARAQPQKRSAASLPMPPPPVLRGGTATTPAMEAGQKQAMDALLDRLEKAVARAESVAGPAPASEGDAAPSDLSLGAVAAGAALPAELREQLGADSAFAPYEERIVTAGRRSQSTFEAAYATTVITAEDIRLAGANTLYELLRRVPGAEVMAMGVGSANVSFRGFNQRLANKVLVLVDGRSEYQDFLGLTLWSALPVGLEEIERIEVIRGPGSALYGAGAMLGVVNIITRTPGTGKAGDLTAYAGAGNSAGGSFVGSGGNERLRYRASVGYAQSDKWSRDFGSDRPDVEPQVENPNLGLQSARANMTATYRPMNGLEVGVSAGVNRLFTEFYAPGLLRNYSADGAAGYAKLDVTTGPVKLKAFWNHFDAAAGPQYAAIGARSMATHMESNVFDGELSFVQGFEAAGHHQLSLGVSGRLKRVGWDYLGGMKEEQHWAAFFEDEWRITQTVRVVGSLRADNHPLLDKGQAGIAYSPRLSVLWIPAEGHGLRASAASAFRAPTFLESYTLLRVPVPGVPGASGLTSGNLTLRPERLTAFEIGYRGENARLGVDWDVTVYNHAVKDLIGLSPMSRLPAEDTFDELTQTYLLGQSFFQNEPSRYNANGLELSASAAPVDGLGIKLSGALQRISSNGEAADCGPCLQAPTAKVYGSITYRTPARVSFGVEGGYTSATEWIEREPSSSDPTAVVNQHNALPAYSVFHARVGFEPIADRLALELRGTHLGSPHQQHPFGNTLDRRVYLTVRITP
ncbi:MAG: TonB-dependent receptor [Myxococcaceae bacterium]|nr:TonB-dependent receptor [Myxococcaceae bacterium]